MNNKNISIALLAGASFFWGSALVAQRLGLSHLEPFSFNAVRFFFGSLSVLPLLPLQRLLLGTSTPVAAFMAQASGRRLAFWGALLCGGSLFAAISLQQIGIAYTSVGKAGFLTSLYIIIVPLLGFLIRKAAPNSPLNRIGGGRVGLHIWLCCALAIFGMYLLCMTEALSLNPGDVLMIFCALAMAFQLLFVAYYAPLFNPLKLTFLQFLTCAIFSAICALLWENPDLYAVRAAWLPLFYTAVISGSVAYSMQIFGQRAIAPMLAALIFSLESVFAALAGWLVLGETLTVREISGCLLIFIAIVLAQVLDMLRLKK
ncbi:MAG: DMT family transporter [Deltaproteobacteria bacterium]|jgi:drug/metabolite transporter (DMT)-like permease|nr:DMT family transporter [Deltaproteobacteria bacterium]